LDFWIFIVGIAVILVVVGFLTMYAVRKVEEKPPVNP
jgi:uncharacterized membrane protein